MTIITIKWHLTKAQIRSESRIAEKCTRFFFFSFRCHSKRNNEIQSGERFEFLFDFNSQSNGIKMVEIHSLGRKAWKLLIKSKIVASNKVNSPTFINLPVSVWSHAKCRPLSLDFLSNCYAICHEPALNCSFKTCNFVCHALPFSSTILICRTTIPFKFN